MPEKMSWFSFARVAARALLQFRETRRKIIFYTIVALLVVFALGHWVLDDWLWDNPMWCIFYWAGCAFLSIFLFLLGPYDFLRIIKEYKDARGRLR